MKPDANWDALKEFQTPEKVLGLVNADGLRQVLATAIVTKRVPGDERPEWAITATNLFWAGVLDFPRKATAR